MKIKLFLVFTTLSIFLFYKSYAQWTPQSVPDPKKDGGGFVSNPDKILNQNTVDKLNEMLKLAKTDTIPIEIAVVVLQSIGNKVPKEFATELFNYWKIGDKNLNNGLLVLLVMDQRRVEFETGYGVEQVLTDAVCYQIQQENMVPYFKSGDYDMGILSGVEWILKKYNNPNVDNYSPQQTNNTDNSYNYKEKKGFPKFFMYYFAFCLISTAIFLIILLIAYSQKDYYKRYKMLKPFTLFAFPVFMPIPFLPLLFFNKKILEQWRNTPRISPKGKLMRKLNEKEDDKYLEKGQVTEEHLKSVDYDVWVADETSEVLILAYKRWFSGYSQCPKCSYLTYHLEYDRVIEEATTISSGRGERKYSCEHCKHSKIVTYTIPKITETSSSSGGSDSGGSDSWGGGSSGGGGAGSSW